MFANLTFFMIDTLKHKGGNQWVFVDRVPLEADWKAQDDPNTTWNKIAYCIKRVAKDVLGESRGGAPPCKDTSW